jgi:O-antigen/teichoic acid export membrane protein
MFYISGLSMSPFRAFRKPILSGLRPASMSRAAWTIADQAMVSAGNFVSGVIIARHLPSSAFGEYALLLATMLFLNSLHSALVTYPLSVRGATHDPATLRRIATASLWMTLGLLPVLGAVMGLGVYFGAATASGPRGLLELVTSAAGAMLLWQMQETVRRTLMAELRFMACIPGDAISYLGQAALLLALTWSGRLTLSLAFSVIGVTSAAALVVQTLQIGLVRLRFTEVVGIARDLWKLGSWTLLTNLSGLVALVGYTWTLKIFRGLDETAAYAAMIVPTKLANPLLIGIGNLLVPGVAKVARRFGRPATIGVAGRYGLAGAAIIFLYYGLLAAFPTLALRLIFKKESPYLAVAGPLRWYVLNLGVFYIEGILLAWLYGLGKTRANFASQLLKASIIVLVALPATASYGVYGLIAGNLAATTLCVMMQVLFLRRALAVGIRPERELVRTSNESLPALD